MHNTFIPIFQDFWDNYSELATVIFVSYAMVNIILTMLIYAGGSPEQRWNLPDDVSLSLHMLKWKILNFLTGIGASY